MPPVDRFLAAPRRSRVARQSRSRARAVSIVAALAVFASGLAFLPAPYAQTTGKSAGAGGTLADAKSHMDKGQGFFLEKKFAEAAAEFHKAYEIKPLSTFLFNEAVCHEKLGERDTAIALFKKYLDTDSQAPDRKTVEARIAKLETEKTAAAGDAGAETSEEAGAGDAATDAAPITPQIVAAAASIDEMRSIVVVESVPDGAPVEIWQRVDALAPKFVIGSANTGWQKVVIGTTTLIQSLPLGTYHVVIPKFQDYRATETDVVVAAATISQFKANLAQGAFFGVLKLRTMGDEGEVRGAHVFIKKPDDKKFVDRGTTPYEESLESGTYTIRVEQPGFEPIEKSIDVVHGKLDEQKLELQRSDSGLIRVEVTNADQAEVIVDDHAVGIWADGVKIETPVKSGRHRVKVKADDRKTYTADVDVPRGKMVVLHAELRPAVPRGPAWTTAVASAVFLGGGIYLGIKSNDYRDQLNAAQASGRLDQEDTRIKKGKYFAIAADSCFAVSGILGLISLYNFVKDPLPPSKGWVEAPRDLDVLPPAPKPVSFKVLPMAGPTVAGLSLLVEF
ncbi:MAG: PEGA domain-containing protein [Polyangiales bacterium]